MGSGSYKNSHRELRPSFMRSDILVNKCWPFSQQFGQNLQELVIFSDFLRKSKNSKIKILKLKFFSKHIDIKVLKCHLGSFLSISNVILMVWNNFWWFFEFCKKIVFSPNFWENDNFHRFCWNSESDHQKSSKKAWNLFEWVPHTTPNTLGMFISRLLMKI